MGNQQSTQEQQLQMRFRLMFDKNYEICQKRIDETIGEVELYRIKNTGHRQIMTKQIRASGVSVGRIVEGLRQRIASPIPNMINIYHIEIADFLCSDDRVIKIYFQYVKRSLKGELRRRRKMRYYFSEDQLWKILISLVNAVKNLHDRNSCHMEIGFETVIIDEDYQVKLIERALLDTVSWVVDCKRGGVKLVKGYGVLFSPCIVRQIVGDFTEMILRDGFKGDVFAIGILLLECAALKSSLQFYDYESFTVDMEGIGERIFQVRKRYSFELINLIKQMLRDRDEERPSSNELYEKIQNIPSEHIKELQIAINSSVIESNLTNISMMSF